VTDFQSALDAPECSWQFEYTKEMAPGQRIAIKDFHIRRSGLPFSTVGGNPVCLMNIKAIGTITGNHRDGTCVQVDWHRPLQSQKWYFHAQRYLVWKVQRLSWKDEALIAFAFSGVAQDIQRFHDDHPWMRLSTKEAAARQEQEQELEEAKAFLRIFGIQVLTEAIIASLAPQDLLSICNVIKKHLECWAYCFNDSSCGCNVNFKAFDWANRSRLASIDGIALQELDEFLDSLGELAKSLSLARMQAKQMQAPVPAWAQEHYDELTEVDKDVLYLISKGYANAQIASTLHMSLGNVNKRCSEFIFPALGVRSRTGAVDFINSYKPEGSLNRRPK